MLTVSIQWTHSKREVSFKNLWMEKSRFVEI